MTCRAENPRLRPPDFPLDTHSPHLERFLQLRSGRGLTECEMISTRMFVFAALVAFWILGLASEFDSARATTAYLLISLVLLISTAAFKSLRPAAE